MTLFDDARVTLLVADYVGVDAGGKLNVLGLGFTISGLQPTGATAPQAVAALVDLPSRYVGQDFALSIDLRDDTTGEIVQVQRLDGGQDALRVQQNVTVQPIAVPGLQIPREMNARVQVNLGFPGGLPLVAGHFYSWRAEIDGNTKDVWRATFWVVGPPPGPVFGGPAGPAAIPGLAP
jgi:hypothetical protein